MKRKKYLITGGLGVIGSELANKLDGDITVLTRTDKNKKRLKRKDIKLLVKPLQETTLEDLKGIDVIYHCASKVGNYYMLEDPYIDVEVNIKGTIHLLELIKQMKKKPKLIFLSTFFVYGNVYDQIQGPINENSKTNPLAMYSTTKLCAEQTIQLYGRLYEIPYLICRITNVYGENEEYDNKQKGALNFLIMQAVKGEPLKIYKGGNYSRDYIHLDDVVDALIHLQDRENELYLVGHGVPVNFRKLIDTILDFTDFRSKLIEVEPPFLNQVMGISSFIADTTKLQETGWKPKIDIELGLKRVITKYKKIVDKEKKHH